ncbi:MAG: DUF2062 domain-containing protein [Pirellulaceae bacterium]
MLQRRIRQIMIHHVLHADDPPHRLALGMAIGVFVTFTPTIGFQMMLVVLFAWLLRGNKVVGLPIVWLTNPATIVPLYYPCYVVGRVLLNEPEVGWQWWRELRTPPPGWWAGVEFYWSRMLDIAVPLWLGSLVVATLLGLLTYYVAYIAICWYRLKRWGQLTKPAQ